MPDVAEAFVSAMKTELLRPDDSGIERAAGLLRQGGLVAVPTETVYGLAANALDGQAVSKIFLAKGRPQDNPLIVHISSLEELFPLVAAVPAEAEKLAKAYWPGPLTMIFQKSSLIPQEVSAGLDTVAVRFPSHPVARRVISMAGVPLAAPSANLSGSPSPTCARHVMDDMDGRIDAVLDGGSCDVGVESTVISMAARPFRLLRPGGITLEQLEAVLGKVEVDPAVLHKLEEGRRAASPGMKYKHYAPKAHVTLVKGESGGYADFVNGKGRENTYALCFEEDVALLRVPHVCFGRRSEFDKQAQELFFDLRELDKKGAKEIYVHCPEATGVGLAVYNRLIRAAAFEIIDLSAP